MKQFRVIDRYEAATADDFELVGYANLYSDAIKLWEERICDTDGECDLKIETWNIRKQAYV